MSAKRTGSVAPDPVPSSRAAARSLDVSSTVAAAGDTSTRSRGRFDPAGVQRRRHASLALGDSAYPCLALTYDLAADTINQLERWSAWSCSTCECGRTS
jgi:hypothetical protein